MWIRALSGKNLQLSRAKKLYFFIDFELAIIQRIYEMRGKKTHNLQVQNVYSKLNILLKPAFEPQNWFKTSKNHIIKFG